MSFKIEHPRRRLVLTLMVGILILWGFYLKTLSPAFPPDDSPETITAAFSLGIQHPPGYPLAALLGRSAIEALPLGGPAFRMNLLSAALACLSAALAGLWAWRLGGGAPRAGEAVALATVLALGSLAIYWDQATAAKGGIYLLNLALGFGLWHAALSGTRRAAWAWSLAAGLMVANHYPSAALWILPTGLWLFWQRRAPLKALLAFLPGLSLYLYLPLRAAQAPILNWGDPRSWTQFWWVLGRGGYNQAMVTDHVGTARDQALAWLHSLQQPAWIWVPLLGALGLWTLWRKQRVAAWALSAALTLALVAALGVNKTTVENRWLCLIFALPATALLAPLAGLGLRESFERWAPRATGVAWPLALAAGLLALSLQSSKADRSGSYVAWDYAHDLALSLPRGSLYLAEGDFHLLPLVETQVVEGRRGDVLGVLNALNGEAWYQQTLLPRDPGLRLPPLGAPEPVTLELAKMNASRRPLMVGPYSVMLTAAQGVPLHQRGLARAVSPPQPEPDFAAAWAARAPARQDAELEKIESDLLPWYTVALTQTGNEALDGHRAAPAILAYRRALERPGPKPEGPLAYNLGLAYEEAHRKDLAILAYQRCVRLDATFVPGAERLKALLAFP